MTFELEVTPLELGEVILMTGDPLHRLRVILGNKCPFALAEGDVLRLRPMAFEEHGLHWPSDAVVTIQV